MTKLLVITLVLLVSLLYVSAEHVEEQLRYCYPTEDACKHGDGTLLSCTER